MRRAVTVETALWIAGPALTTAGAALLAYDVLRGPARALRDVGLAARLDAANGDRDLAAQSIADLAAVRTTLEHSAELARVDADHANAVTQAEALHARAEAADRHRAFRLAVWGLCLVTAGAASQTVAAILGAARAP